MGALSTGALFLLRTRPDLSRRVWRIGYYMAQYLNHCVGIAIDCAHSHPRAARSIGAGTLVAAVGVSILHAFSSLFAVAILLATVKAAYSAVQIALMIAAVRGAIQTAAKLRRTGWTVIRHADATKQKLISAVGQLSPAQRGSAFDGRGQPKIG